MSETCRLACQNKFEKLVHLVGFIIRICHDARSYERKMLFSICIFLDKIQEYRTNWLQYINGMPHNRLPRIIKKTTDKKQKKQAKTVTETSGCDRQERVNK
jgi:hypothetical protein